MVHWPQDLDDVPNADIDNDEYLNAFLKSVDDTNWSTSVSPGTWLPIGPPAKRQDVPDIDEDPYLDGILSDRARDIIPTTKSGVQRRRRALLPRSDMTTPTDLAIVDQESGHEKRFVKALFVNLGKFLARIAGWLSKEVKRLNALKKNGGLKIAEKGKGKSIADQYVYTMCIAGRNIY
jgi:hypothetical protein